MGGVAIPELKQYVLVPSAPTRTPRVAARTRVVSERGRECGVSFGFCSSSRVFTAFARCDAHGDARARDDMSESLTMCVL